MRGSGKSSKQKKGITYINAIPLRFLAGPTGLEPATSCVTGRRSNQLNYDPVNLVGGTGIEPVTLGL